mgnify:CR=1 FL=1
MIDDPLRFLRRAHEALRAARLLLEAGLPDLAAAPAQIALLACVRALLSHLEFVLTDADTLIRTFDQQLVRTGVLPDTLLEPLKAATALRLRADALEEPPLTAESLEPILEAADLFIVLTGHFLSSPETGEDT